MRRSGVRLLVAAPYAAGEAANGAATPTLERLGFGHMLPAMASPDTAKQASKANPRTDGEYLNTLARGLSVLRAFGLLDVIDLAPRTGQTAHCRAYCGRFV